MNTRSWCPCCIAAKAKHWPHRRALDVEGAEEGVPYWFMRDDEVDEIVTVINSKEKHTKAFGAHAVKKKGLDAGVAERTIKHIERWSCKDKLIVKNDQEPSIQAVSDEIRRIISGETIFMALPSGRCRQWKVKCEQCCWHWRADSMPRSITWLVEHSADILNKFVVGIDWRTAVKGSKETCTTFEFGRRVLYKIPCEPEED